MALDLVSESEHTMALCAFTLSQLSSAAAQKRMVKEMWETGADIMVRRPLKLALTGLHNKT